MDLSLNDNLSNAITETIAESVLILDGELKVIFANQSFSETFQVDAKKTEGKLIFKLGNGQWDIPELRQLLQEVLSKGTSFKDFEVNHKFLGIGRKTMLLNARQLHQRERKDGVILLAIEDITQRKLLEDRLARYTTGLEKKVVKTAKKVSLGKAREAAILQSIGDGLIVMIDADKGGRIVYVNKAFEEMVGWKTKEVLNKYIVDVMPREDKNGNIVPFNDRVLTRVLAGERVIADLNEPFYYLRKDNSKFPVASVISPIVVNKKIVGAVEIFRDITKESAADKAKTEFASLVSHQLRTPFSTVNWYVELLLAGDAGKLNAKQTEYLEEVYRASKRMVDLVNVLLSISRIEMGISTIDTRQVNVISIAEEILKERKLESQKNKVKIRKTYDKNIPSIQADPKQMSMIFQNLLSNAIKYTPPAGEIDVSISYRRGAILITVTDTGMGIPKEDQPKIFSRFFRATNAKAQEPEGVGLGLYILKAIIDQMSGKIWFKSKENKGTTFYVTLPTKAPKRKAGKVK